MVGTQKAEVHFAPELAEEDVMGVASKFCGGETRNTSFLRGFTCDFSRLAIVGGPGPHGFGGNPNPR